jgi:hypothetical protein
MSCADTDVAKEKAASPEIIEIEESSFFIADILLEMTVCSHARSGFDVFWDEARQGFPKRARKKSFALAPPRKEGFTHAGLIFSLISFFYQRLNLRMSGLAPAVGRKHAY